MPWWCGRGPSYVDDERTAEGSYDRVAGGALIADELAVDDARNEAPDASVSSRSRPLVSSSGKPSAPEGMAMSITGELDGSNEMSPERLSLVWPRGDRCGVTLVRGEIDSAKICGDRLSVSTAGDRGETWASREKSSGAGRRLVDDPPLDFGLRDPASVCARSAGEDDDKVVLRREAPRGGVAVGVDGELSTNVRGEAFDVVGRHGQSHRHSVPTSASSTPVGPAEKLGPVKGRQRRGCVCTGSGLARPSLPARAARARWRHPRRRLRGTARGRTRCFGPTGRAETWAGRCG